MQTHARGVAVGRRQFPRLELDGDLEVSDLASGLVMTVLDISVGGFGTRSPIALSPGIRGLFRFRARGHETLLVEARVIHCYPTDRTHRDFTIGWMWLDLPVNVSTVFRLMDWISVARPA